VTPPGNQAVKEKIKPLPVVLGDTGLLDSKKSKGVLDCLYHSEDQGKASIVLNLKMFSPLFLVFNDVKDRHEPCLFPFFQEVGK